MQIERKGRKMIQGIFVRCRRCVSESEDSFIYKPTHPHIHLPTHTPSHPYTYTHPYNYPTVHLSTHTPIHPYTGWIGVILVHNCVLPLISFYWADKSSIFINYWTIRYHDLSVVSYQLFADWRQRQINGCETLTNHDILR